VVSQVTTRDEFGVPVARPFARSRAASQTSTTARVRSQRIHARPTGCIPTFEARAYKRQWYDAASDGCDRKRRTALHRRSIRG
jgi:hypothetical protein